MSKLSAEQTTLIQSNFTAMDVNGDGFVTKDELKGLLQGLGEEFAAEVIDEMLAMTDENGDGKISFAEFVKAATVVVLELEAQAEAAPEVVPEVVAEVETQAEVQV